MYDPATGELLEEAMADEVYEEDEDDDDMDVQVRVEGGHEVAGAGEVGHSAVGRGGRDEGRGVVVQQSLM